MCERLPFSSSLQSMKLSSSSHLPLCFPYNHHHFILAEDHQHHLLLLAWAADHHSSSALFGLLLLAAFAGAAVIIIIIICISFLLRRDTINTITSPCSSFFIITSLSSCWLHLNTVIAVCSWSGCYCQSIISNSSCCSRHHHLHSITLIFFLLAVCSRPC